MDLKHLENKMMSNGITKSHDSYRNHVEVVSVDQLKKGDIILYEGSGREAEDYARKLAVTVYSAGHSAALCHEGLPTPVQYEQAGLFVKGKVDVLIINVTNFKGMKTKKPIAYRLVVLSCTPNDWKKKTENAKNIRKALNSRYRGKGEKATPNDDPEWMKPIPYYQRWYGFQDDDAYALYLRKNPVKPGKEWSLCLLQAEKRYRVAITWRVFSGSIEAVSHIANTRNEIRRILSAINNPNFATN